MAIDRKDLVKRLAGGNGQPANPGFLSPDNPYYTPVPQYDFDVAGAKALLDCAGYRAGPDGARRGPRGPLKFELLVADTSVPLAELIVSALKKVGITLTTKAVQGGPQLFGPKFSGQFDMALLGYPGPTAAGRTPTPICCARCSPRINRLHSPEPAATSIPPSRAWPSSNGRPSTCRNEKPWSRRCRKSSPTTC